VKRCSKCSIDKDESEFYLDKRRNKPQAKCKLCYNADSKAYAAANPEKRKAQHRAYQLAYPERLAVNSRAWQLRNPEKTKVIAWKSKYGIDFEALWKAQEGLCASCHKPMRRGGREIDSVCVDHDKQCCPGRKSCGKCVRGLVHRNCNLVLGYARDDLCVLKSSLIYLEKWKNK
jgi:hypothetical protein